MQNPLGSRQRYPGESLLTFKRGPLAFLSELQQTHGDIAHFTVASENFYDVALLQAIDQAIKQRERVLVAKP